MEAGIQLIIMGVFGAICAAIAVSRGRSAVGWFFLGFLFSLLGLILVLVLPDLKVQQEREYRMIKENRRLREKLKKDRQVSDYRHQEVAGRLTVHDRALGLDTANRLGAPDAPLELDAPPIPVADIPDHRTVEWFYVRGGSRVGPIAFEDLKTLWDGRAIHPKTMVWNRHLSNWATIEELGNLIEELRA